MDKQEKEEIKKHFINKTLKMSNHASISIPPQQNDKFIELTIPLNSWSPVNNLSKKLTYKEKLAPDIFDYEQPIEKQDINCYLDHKMSIENLLASTKNKSMEITKENNIIKAKVKIDESDEKLRRTAKLIREKVVTSNSFIFKAIEVELNDCKTDECEQNDDTDIEIIYKKGKLISIDPVYEGFYPQANCQVYDNSTQEFKNINNILELLKQKREKTMEQQTQKPTETKAIEKIAESFELLAKSIKEENQQALQITKENLQTTKNAIEKLVEQQNIITTKTSNYDKLLTGGINNQQEEEYKRIKEILIERNEKITTITPEQKAIVYKKEFDEFSKFVQKYKANPNDQSFWTSSWMFDQHTYNFRDLDGTNSLKGLALIQNILQPGILVDLLTVFPEISSAKWIPLIGLNEIRQAIYNRNNEKLSPTLEAAELPVRSGTVYTVILKPTRIGMQVVQNNALSVGVDLWSVQTTAMRDTVVEALREAFYLNLFNQADKRINELETSAKSDYNEGATIEAKIETTNKKITWVDIDKLIKENLAKYGSKALEKIVILMHVDTYAKLTESFILGDKNPSYLLKLEDPSSYLYRGVKIITSMIYPDKPNPTTGVFDVGKKPAIAFNLESVTVYGTNIAIFDDPYTGAGKDQRRRIIQTRGEIKLTDPHIATRYLQVKA